MTLAEINALRFLDRDALVQRGFDVGLDMTDGAERWPTDDSLRLAIIQKGVGTALEEQGDGPPPIDEIADSYFSEAIDQFAEASARSDLVLAQRLAGGLRAEVERDQEKAEAAFRRANGATLLALVASVQSGLGGIEDRLCEIRDGVRD